MRPDGIYFNESEGFIGLTFKFFNNCGWHVAEGYQWDEIKGHLSGTTDAWEWYPDDDERYELTPVVPGELWSW